MTARLLVAAFLAAALGAVALRPGPGRTVPGDGGTPAGSSRRGDAWTGTVDGAELLLVPGGEFTMGSDAGAFDERPAHRVRVASFLIDRTEVTNTRFEAFVARSGYRPEGPWRLGAGPGLEQHPVRFVSWFDAAAYCRWAGRALPTEARWELAARGRDGHTYPWGDRFLPGLAWTDAGVDAGPVATGSFAQGAAACGALDLAGNVWEWVADWYDRHLYESLPQDAVAVEPAGPPDGAPPEERFVRNGTAAGNERSTLKAIRGGGWASPGVDDARGSRRMWGNPRSWFDDTGFRCSLALPERP